MNIAKRPPVTNCPLCGGKLTPVYSVNGDMLVCGNYQDGCKLHHRPLDSTEFRAIDDAIKGAYERARDEAAQVVRRNPRKINAALIDLIHSMQYHQKGV